MIRSVSYVLDVLKASQPFLCVVRLCSPQLSSLFAQKLLLVSPPVPMELTAGQYTLYLNPEAVVLVSFQSPHPCLEDSQNLSTVWRQRHFQKSITPKENIHDLSLGRFQHSFC